MLALDYDASAVAHLARRYPALAAVRGNLAALPVAGDSIDTVVSLQVIEHVWDHPQFVAECARVLRPGGLLVLSTPNRLTFSPGTDKPVNPFHTHEFTAAELCRLVAGAGLRWYAVRGLFAGPGWPHWTSRHAGQGGLVAAQLAEPAAALDGRAGRRRRLGPAGRTFETRPGLPGSRSWPGLDASLDLVLLARRP